MKPGFWVGRPFLSRRFLRPRRRAQPFSLKALGQQALHRPPLHPEKMARGSCFPAQALNNEQDAKGSQTTVLLSSVFRFLPVSFVFSYFWGW